MFRLQPIMVPLLFALWLAMVGRWWVDGGSMSGTHGACKSARRHHRQERERPGIGIRDGQTSFALKRCDIAGFEKPASLFRT